MSAFHSSNAQEPSAKTNNSVTGTWKGSSICQVKSSPCHDEKVVYHISPAGGIDSFNIQANKIVNGQEVDMGVLPCRYDKKNNQLTSTAFNGNWIFNFKDGSIDGTLFFKGELYRIIKLEKQE